MAMNASESRRYSDIVGPDIGDVISEESIIVLPVGAVEQHGPHLPMSVDDVIAASLRLLPQQPALPVHRLPPEASNGAAKP